MFSSITADCIKKKKNKLIVQNELFSAFYLLEIFRFLSYPQVFKILSESHVRPDYLKIDEKNDKNVIKKRHQRTIS